MPEAEKLIGRRTAPAPPFDGATHDVAPEGGAQHAQPEPCSAEDAKDRDAKGRLAAKANAAQEGERSCEMERMVIKSSPVKSSQVISESLSDSKPKRVGEENHYRNPAAAARGARGARGATRFLRGTDRRKDIFAIVATDDRSEHSATPTTRFTQRGRAGTDRDVGVDTSG